MPEWAPHRSWSMPDGKLECTVKASRRDWLEARRSMIGASDLALLMNASAFGDQYTLWLDKKGLAPSDDGGTDAMRRGQIFEQPVLDMWAERVAQFPIVMRRQGLVRSKRLPVAGATVDRLSICPTGRCVVEVKTANDLAEWADDEVPTAFQLQGQWQLFVTGRDHVHFVVMGPRWHVVDRIMQRDETLMATLAAKVSMWWSLYIDGDAEPVPTSRAAGAIRQRYAHSDESTFIIEDVETADMFRSLPILKAELDAAAEQYDGLLAQVLARVGAAERVMYEDSDEIVASYSPGKTVDGANAAWRRAHPELVDEFSTLEPVLNVAKLVEAHPELISAAGGLRRRRTWSLK